MIKDRPLSIRVSCQWADLYRQYVQHKHFNWINFDFIGFNFEWGGYKGDYFEINGWVLGFGFTIEWFDYDTREVRIKEWTKDIPEELTDKELKKSGFKTIEECVKDYWANDPDKDN